MIPLAPCPPRLPRATNPNRAVDAGTLDPQTINIASPTEIERMKAAGGAACGKWDGHWICVSRASNPRFATYIETGKDPG